MIGLYYSDHVRVKRMEKLLEKLAYISVALDFIVALASFLVLKRAAFSSVMLAISGDLVLVEMGIITVIFMTLTAMKHYGRIMAALEQAKFRSRHARIGAVFGVR